MDTNQKDVSTGNIYPGQVPYNYVPKKPVLPHSVSSLIFGIVSLSTMALFGWIMGIVALIHSKNALQAATDEPGKYNENSIRMAKSGRTMGLVGLILGLAGILLWVLYFAFLFFLIDKAEHFHYDYYNTY